MAAAYRCLSCANPIVITEPGTLERNLTGHTNYFAQSTPTATLHCGP